jgi:Tol biopolymer transport system component
MVPLAVRPALYILWYLVLLLGLACGGGGDDTGSDGDANSSDVDDARLAAGAVSEEQLELMALPPEAFGADYSDLSPDDDQSGFTDSDEKAADADDPEDEAEDLERFGWAAGYQRNFTHPDAVSVLTDGTADDDAPEAPLSAGSVVDLFDTVDGASGYFQDARTELQDIARQTDETFTISESNTFAAGIADEGVGFRLTGSFQQGEGVDSISISAAGVLFRRGRLQGAVVLANFGDSKSGPELGDQVEDLARKLDDRILSVLRGELTGPAGATATAAPPPGAPATGKIAFSAGPNGSGSIFVMNADGSGQTSIGEAFLSSCPSWSPDGTRIAFVSGRFDITFSLYTINADGSGQTNLLKNAGVSAFANDCPAWSPDGSRIAFEGQTEGDDNLSDVFVINSDGSGLARLTDAVHRDSSPAWSPDGTRIVFLAERDENFEVYVMNADGSGQTNLTNSPDQEAGPVWSPDGGRIAYVVWNSANEGIYAMNADGSGKTNLIEGEDIYTPPDAIDWSPDGRRIAFVGGLEHALYVVNADGSGLREITSGLAPRDARPAWSPGGTHIAYVGIDNGINEIYVIGVDGIGLARLTSGGASRPAWQPEQ